jgi:DNA-binding ferritin-like protein (Dps family)
MSNTKTDERKSPLWNQVLGLLEEDLAERRSKRAIVGVPGESGAYQKEVGKLSIQELRSLDPVLREYAGEQLLDRYLAEQGYVDLIEKGRAYTKKIQDLIPADLPALIEADRYETEERQKRREREKFVRDMREGLNLPGVKKGGLAHPLWMRTRV